MIFTSGVVPSCNFGVNVRFAVTFPVAIETPEANRLRSLLHGSIDDGNQAQTVQRTVRQRLPSQFAERR